ISLLPYYYYSYLLFLILFTIHLFLLYLTPILFSKTNQITPLSPSHSSAGSPLSIIHHPSIFPPIFTSFIYQFTIFQLYKYPHSLHIHSHLQNTKRNSCKIKTPPPISLHLRRLHTHLIHTHTCFNFSFIHPFSHQP